MAEPALDADSYSSFADIEARMPQYTNNGIFDKSTFPTRKQLAALIDDTSSIVNAILKGAGFTIPVAASMADKADHAVRLLDAWVADVVAEQIEGINRAGRFAPGATELRSGRTVAEEIARSFARWIYGDEDIGLPGQADALEDLGATRSGGLTDGLSYRTQDAAGTTLKHPFGRKQFGTVAIDHDPSTS